ncbi:MAG TPA: ATP-binding cassette domain-containing protein, partial [Paracoccaceae bacterium]|nr:ATP-binding cassette domain-containing protein [Paracoccaceae bacterium]
KGVMTVAENLAFWADVHGTGPGAVDAALARMDLRGMARRPAQNLSAGQKRRLGLARLLVAGRGLWLLDEPTVSLDAAAVALFARVVADHLAGGGAVLAATHVELSIPGAEDFDLAPFRARPPARDAAFGEGLA